MGTGATLNREALTPAVAVRLGRRSLFNHDVLGSLGDCQFKHYAAINFERENGMEFALPGDVAKPIAAVATNESLASMYQGVLGFKLSDIETGEQYRYATLERSIHRQATVIEAIITVVQKVLGGDVAQQFVDRLCAIFFQKQGTSFLSFRSFDPISSVMQKVAQLTDGVANYQVSDKPDAEGNFTGRLGIKMGPNLELFLKGPQAGRRKNDVKRALFQQMDLDAEFNDFIRKNPKKAKVELSEEAASVSARARENAEAAKASVSPGAENAEAGVTVSLGV
ncbi:hypothetical protein KFL_006390040 [Klebsormidium nitens]|uniref:Uncharacterized protein n=1 Tax=Klebsormidium nitens TaxID=105231 RepID=A0A1Y1ILW5_KLENI|nr:hypothetical protein KFL_006390040 [Klebsormidium nitens]|eukprot:GAQ90439.1 hypothetical protein KFL_006390040 [Klebsormidium nitens]